MNPTPRSRSSRSSFVRSLRALRAIGAPLAVALALTTLCRPSFADAYDAAMAQAIAAKEQALNTNDPADWQNALRLFVVADTLKPTKDSKYELAVAAQKLREDDLAVESYEASIALGLGGTAKVKAQTFVSENAPKMGRLEMIAPAGARLEINTRKRGVLPLSQPVVVFSGKVHVAVVSEGKTIEDDVATTAGETTKLDWTSRFAATPVVKHDDVVAPTSSETGAGARALGWTLVVSGGVILVSGVVTTLLAGSKIDSLRSDLASKCKKPIESDYCNISDLNSPSLSNDAQTDVDGLATWKPIRVVGFVAIGVGGAATIAGIVRLVTAPSSSSSSGGATGATFSPTMAFSPHGGMSLGLTGRF